MKKKIILALLILAYPAYLSISSNFMLSDIDLITDSAEYLTESTGINVFISFLCLLLLFLILITQINIKKVVLVVLITLLWVLAGIKIGIKDYPEGRITQSIYKYKYKTIELCKKDCENVLYNTKISKKAFWGFGVENINVKDFVFVGPFNWINCKKLLDKKKGFIGNDTE